MALFEKQMRWNGWVVALLATGSILGLGNSVLQLSRYGAEIAGRFGAGDWTMIIIWSALFVVWVLILGLISGIAIGRLWYGADSGSMAPSD